MSRIVVLFAACNGAEWIEEQLLSILHQRNVQVEIFISVDPSTDDTLALCQKMASQYQAIKLLPMRAEPNGAAGNFLWLIRNVDLSPYDYIALADQDDLWFSDKLSRSCSTILEQGVAAYSSNVIALWPDRKKKLIVKNHPQKQWDFLFEAAGPGCTYVLTQSLAQAFKDFLTVNWLQANEVGFHDWLIYAFTRSKGYKWYIDGNATMLYRQHEKNQLGINQGVSAYRLRYKLIANGAFFNKIRSLCQLLSIDHPFVSRWIVFDSRALLKLAVAAPHCRRKFSDQAIMALLCFWLSIVFRMKKTFGQGH
ncbi:glycosyltransferase [Pelobacter sp. M08fum]|uniref:Glycosyltransferase n=2 Tax=Pelovirga terrestris TaxID=2771352 RepID=A0A8J6ULK5_9BACT|nr:glycosyltransferase [Pelovirga terrestris]